MPNLITIGSTVVWHQHDSDSDVVPESSLSHVTFSPRWSKKYIREVKHDVYGKRQTAKIELLVSDFSRLYNLGKLFAFTVIKGFFSYFSTGFIKVLKKKWAKSELFLPFAVCRKRHA